MATYTEIDFNDERVRNAQNFFVQYLRDAGYDGALEEGTAANDILIRGMSVLYTLFKEDVDRSSAYQSIENAQSFKDMLGEEYDVAIDSILSNWFVTRKGGFPTQGRIRLKFIRPLDYFMVDPEKVIAEIDGETFVPAFQKAFTSEDFTPLVNTIENRVEYYLEVSVVSVENTDTIINPISTGNAYIDHVYYLNYEIPETFSPGAVKEDSQRFIERTDEVITTREMITHRAIKTVLLDEFADLEAVYVAGHGEPEQMRDVVEFDFVKAHIGNKADIYIKGRPFSITTTATVQAGGYVDLDVYALDILLVAMVPDEPEEESEEAVEEPQLLDFEIVEHDETSWLSSDYRMRLYLPGGIEGTQVVVGYLTSESPAKVADYLRKSTNRVACYDPLVKAMHQVVLSGSFQISLNAIFNKTDEDIIRETVAAAVDFVWGIRQGENFIVSELIRYIHNNVEGVAKVYLPIQLDAKVRNPADMVDFTTHIDNQYDIPQGLSEQVSWNTIQFYSELEFFDVTILK